MKRYLVDVRGLSYDEKRSIHDEMAVAAFMVNTKVEDGEVVAYEVLWDYESDFEKSASYPKGRPCQLLNP